MKKDINVFNHVVRQFRASTPSYNNGRKVVVLDEYHKNGKRIASIASNWDGHYLNQVYDRPSEDKIKAYNDAFDMCCNSGGTDFDIVSHNNYSFTVAWFCRDKFYDVGLIVVLTSKTEYIVIFND